MTRSRVLLMVAWGLLAAGSVVQFVQSSGDERPTGAERAATAGPPDALATTDQDRDRAGEFGRTGDAAGQAGEGPDPHPRDPDGPHSAGPDRSTATWSRTNEGRLTSILLDDPAGWDHARPRPPAVVATVIGSGVASRTGAGSGPETHWFTNPTQFGGPRTFLVVDETSSETHVKVSLPVMPNGQEGWLPRSAVELSTVAHRAEVDLSEATVTVWDGDEVVATTAAVTGRPSAPTPLGRFYVRDIIAQPNPDGDYGPWILALSGFSEVLRTFEGGLPALALHGTDEPAQIGSALSSGCVRVPNDIITALAETVPLGTPVTVVA